MHFVMVPLAGGPRHTFQAGLSLCAHLRFAAARPFVMYLGEEGCEGGCHESPSSKKQELERQMLPPGKLALSIWFFSVPYVWE